MVSIVGSALAGPLAASGAASLAVCGSTISGPTSVSNTTGLVPLGGTGGSRCGQDAIGAPVTLNGNTGGVVLAGNTISEPASITSNSGGAADRQYHQRAAVLLGERPSAHQRRQPNTVKGPATDQCSALA